MQHDCYSREGAKELTFHRQALPNAHSASTTPSPKPLLPFLETGGVVAKPVLRTPVLRIGEDRIVSVQAPGKAADPHSWRNVLIRADGYLSIWQGDAWISSGYCVAKTK